MADTPDNQDEADAAARRVHAEGAAESEAASDAAEVELERVYKRASSDVQGLVRARGNGLTRRKVANDVERVLDANRFERAKTIAVSIRTSNKVGVKTARKTFTAVYGDEQTRAQVRASTKALQEGAERIAGRTTVDGVGLVKRIKRRDAETVQAIAREVDQVFRAGGGVLDAADRIAKIDGAVPVSLTQYEAELVEHVRKLDAVVGVAEKKAAKSALKKAVGRHLQAVKRLGELQPDGSMRASAYSLRGAGKRFSTAIQRARGQDIDVVIQKHLQERALYRARVIARHESNQAFESAYIEQTRTKPGFIGYRWTVGTHARRPDFCDCLAAANSHDLGPGVYPANDIPTKHPLCKCALCAILDQKHFSRPEGSPRVPDEFKDNVSPGPAAWYRANPTAASAILGPTRVTLMNQGVNVIDRQGVPLPVGELLGLGRAAE